MFSCSSIRVCASCKKTVYGSQRISISQSKRFTSHEITNQHELRTSFEECRKKFNLSDSDWYQQPPKAILDEKTSYMLDNNFKGSMYNALSTLFPETEWHPWKFKHQSVPLGYWKDVSNQRKFFDWLGKEIGVKQLDDWYLLLDRKTVSANGGGTIILIHNGSLLRAFMKCYPEHNWLPWKFKLSPMGFWKSIENQRRYFDWLGNQLGVKELDDWYSLLNTQLLINNFGSALLPMYNGSAITALKSSYPEHNWISWKFKEAPMRLWSSKDNLSRFLIELSEKLSIQTLDDWYRVDLVQLKRSRAWSVVLRYRGLYNILKQHYPHHPWDPRKFQQGGKKAQRWLAVTLKKMFPNEEIVEDYLHPSASFSKSKRPMQLDVFIPSKNLAFEYQGKQHYEDIGVFSPTKQYQQRDKEKRILCAANNIKLIEVPYWWNRTQESLQELIDNTEEGRTSS